MRPPNDDNCDKATMKGQRADHPLNPETGKVLAGAIKRLVFEETTRRLESEYVRFSNESAPVEHICAALIQKGPFNTQAMVSDIEELMLTRREVVRLFERSAAELGKMWEADEQTFLDVTISMARLQGVLRAYVEAQPVEPFRTQEDCHVLISTMPGEEHIFASTLLELSMRLLGWNTTLFSAKTHEELTMKVAANRYDVICLSWTTSALTETLSRLTKTIERFTSDNRPIVIAGGLSSEQKGKWLVRIGVDYICETSVCAVDVVHEVLSRKSEQAFRVAQPLRYRSGRSGAA